MKFALVVDHDPLVFAPVLHEVLLRVASKLDCIVTSPGIRSKKRRAQYSRAVMRIVGVGYVLRTIGRYLRASSWSFGALTRKHGVGFFASPGVNSPEFQTWIRSRGVSVVISLSAEIYKSGTLAMDGVRFFNLHGSLLPSNKGLLPFFWAFMNDTPQGITLHRIVEKIDEGESVLQERLEVPAAASLGTVTDALAARLPDFLARAIDHLERGLAPALDPVVTAPSYGPIPSDEEIVAYFAKLREARAR